MRAVGSRRNRRPATSDPGPLQPDFTFTFTGIEKGEARYGFHAGDNTRATVWKTEAEAAKEVDFVVK
ncbi:hypothetical protein [Amycolatopsis sp. NPDC051371]|uniref:hypothetical protein n=1 Tax=Amycolatopsis sp. NPDC051371 TaxID=3155800 RepID=UPI003434E012